MPCFAPKITFVLIALHLHFGLCLSNALVALPAVLLTVVGDKRRKNLSRNFQQNTKTKKYFKIRNSAVQLNATKKGNRNL